MAAKLYFPVIQEPEEGAFFVEITSETVFNGNEPHENLACGSCKRVWGRNLSSRTFISEVCKAPKDRQLILTCGCGANLLLRRRDAV